MSLLVFGSGVESTTESACALGRRAGAGRAPRGVDQLAYGWSGVGRLPLDAEGFDDHRVGLSAAVDTCLDGPLRAWVSVEGRARADHRCAVAGGPGPLEPAAQDAAALRAGDQ